MDKKLIESGCLTKFLGYGKLNGEYWFIGMEEGGAEIENWSKIGTIKLEESLRLRAKFKRYMDFVEVWEKKYGIPLKEYRGNTVWRYISAFLLCLEKKSVIKERPSSKEIKKFLFDDDPKMGRTDGNHFVCELFPLPNRKSNKLEDEYKSVWSNREEYEDEVRKPRLDIIWRNIEGNPNLKFVIIYGKRIREIFKCYLENLYSNKFKNIKLGNPHFELREITGKSFKILFTPFFGRGLSYDAIKDIVNQLRTLK